MSKNEQQVSSTKQKEVAYQVARHLLHIGAVELSPNDPFTWSSGIKSPIYCDNRLTLSYPQVRRYIAESFSELITSRFPGVETIVGTATAGIPHAAWVAENLDLPMGYVRSSSKKHGKQNLIEGSLKEGEKAVVVEDLISTGGSSLQVVQSLRNKGLDVLGVVAIFTYELDQAAEAFRAANVAYETLSRYSILLQVASEENMLTKEELCKLENWKR